MLPELTTTPPEIEQESQECEKVDTPRSAATANIGFDIEKFQLKSENEAL